jgi:hypothetical protein
MEDVVGTQVGIVKTVWAGTTGGPGLTQTAFTDVTGANLSVAEVQAAVNAVRAFWDAFKSFIPNEVQLTVLPTVDMYDSATNTLNGSMTAATAPAVVLGGETGAYNMAAGLKVNLNTNEIAYGHRVRGAIYVVPAGPSSYSVTGQVSTSAKSAIDAAGATMITAFNTAGTSLMVWSRARTVPTTRAGAVHTVSAVKTNDQAAILRGRRD